jgi:hypothetical protein
LATDRYYLYFSIDLNLVGSECLQCSWIELANWYRNRSMGMNWIEAMDRKNNEIMNQTSISTTTGPPFPFSSTLSLILVFNILENDIYSPIKKVSQWYEYGVEET